MKYRNQKVLKAIKLNKSLGEGKQEQPIIQDVYLDLYHGEVSAIVGPSGCGKTTLLYLLGLLDTTDGGEIWIDDTLTTQLSDQEKTNIRNRSIGFIFQFHFLLGEFTAFENILIPSHKRTSRVGRPLHDYASYLLSAVGLYEKRNRRPSELSGGEQQRIAIARALINQPRIVLADEPTGNLDAKNSEAVLDLLCKLAKENGQGVLLVTHNLVLANRCDHLMQMKDGKLGLCEKSIE